MEEEGGEEEEGRGGERWENILMFLQSCSSIENKQ